MNSRQEYADSIRVGGLLVVVGFVVAVVSYPPPATGFGPLFGVGDLFLRLLVAIFSFVFAAVGGVLLGRKMREAYGDRLQRLAIRLSVPVAAVTLISIYFIGIAGAAPQGPFCIGVVIIAFVDVLLYEFGD